MLELTLRNRTVKTSSRAFVVGIVNCTPDSFYEKSRGGVERAFQLIEEGADILDLGGESTRPGFIETPCEEEIRRLVPVINEIRKHSDIPLSIDTRKKKVFEACFDAGADILNDIASFTFDSELADYAALTGVPVILTHTFPFEREKTFPEEGGNLEIVEELSSWFTERIEYAGKHGISSDKLILDPGIGFGKTYRENMILIESSDKICGGKYPVMMALSRKRCIGQMMGDMEADRLSGTVKADLMAIRTGATFIRVHDVKEHVEALKNM